MNTKMIAAVAGGLFIGAAAFIPLGGSAAPLDNATTQSESKVAGDEPQTQTEAGSDLTTDDTATTDTTDPTADTAGGNYSFGAGDEDDSDGDGDDSDGDDGDDSDDDTDDEDDSNEADD